MMGQWFNIVTKVELKVDTPSDRPVDAAHPVLFGSTGRRNYGCLFIYTR